MLSSTMNRVRSSWVGVEQGKQPVLLRNWAGTIRFTSPLDKSHHARFDATLFGCEIVQNRLIFTPTYIGSNHPLVASCGEIEGVPRKIGWIPAFASSIDARTRAVKRIFLGRGRYHDLENAVWYEGGRISVSVHQQPVYPIAGRNCKVRPPFFFLFIYFVQILRDEV